jgi:hypothetical protein
MMFSWFSFNLKMDDILAFLEEYKIEQRTAFTAVSTGKWILGIHCHDYVN